MFNFKIVHGEIDFNFKIKYQYNVMNYNVLSSYTSTITLYTIKIKSAKVQIKCEITLICCMFH